MRFYDHSSVGGTRMISESEGRRLEAPARAARAIRDAKPATQPMDAAARRKAIRFGDFALQTRLRTLQALAEIRYPRPGRKGA